MNTKTVARFWAKVNKDGPIPSHCPDLGPCWEWTGALSHGKYGTFGFGGRIYLAHRVAWQLAHGAEPPDEVLHRCDNPRCCRDSHLRSGTQRDNMLDCLAKGRHRGVTKVPRRTRDGGRGDKNGSRLHPESRPRGTGVVLAKLDDEKVREIRRMSEAGIPKKRIAAMFGVTRYTILLVVERRTWKHVA